MTDLADPFLMEDTVHLIEQLFGISPDRDSGLTELLLFLGLAVAFLIVRWVCRRGREAE